MSEKIKKQKIFLNAMDSWFSNFIIETFRTDHLPESKYQTEFMGTINDKKTQKLPMYFKPNIINFEFNTAYENDIFLNDIIIYNINTGSIKEIEYIINGLKNNNYNSEKILIIISNIMTWSKTPDKIKSESSNDEIIFIHPDDIIKQQKQEKLDLTEKKEENENNDLIEPNEENKENLDINNKQEENMEEKNLQEKEIEKEMGMESKIMSTKTLSEKKEEEENKKIIVYYTEKDYLLRKPNAKYTQYKYVENEALLLNQKKNIKAYVICPGIIYGYGEKTFYSIFRSAILNLPIEEILINKGRNIIPTIHVKDLINIISKIIEKKPSSYYILAFDQNKNNSLLSITKAIYDCVGDVNKMIATQEELNDNNNDSTKNHTSIQNNTDDFFKKINNRKVNSALNDIYNSISNINEVNKRVKSLLSNRPIIHKSTDNKRNIISKENNKYSHISNSNKKMTEDKMKIVNSRKISMQKNEIKDLNYIPNNNNIPPKSSKYYYKYNINNISNINSGNKKNDIKVQHKKKSNNPINISNIKKISNSNSYITNDYSQTKKNPNYTNGQDYEYINPIPISKKNIKMINEQIDNFNNLNHNNNISNYYENIIQNNILPKNNPDEFIEFDDIGKESNNYSVVSSLRSSVLTNLNCSSIIYDEKLKNEEDIKAMKMKLIKEQQKLKDLEDAKHKLLKEEKIRRKIIMENIKKKNKMKKKAIIKQYKKKISLIKRLQAQNIDEIMQLEKKKKMDENKLRKINNMLNNEGLININIYEKYHKRRHNRNIKRDKELNNNINEILYESIHNKGRDNSNKNENKYFTFSHGFIKGEDSNLGKKFMNNEDKNLTNNYKYINTLYDLTSSANNSNNSKSIISISNNYYNMSNHNKERNPQNKIIKNLSRKESNMNMKYNYSNLYNYFENINNENNFIKKKYNYNNRNINLDNYLIKQKTETKKKQNKFNSDSRKYDKKYYNNTNNLIYKKTSSPKIEMPSFIQSRINKYNYTNSKKSNSSKRISESQIAPYSVNYKCNYNKSSNISNKSNNLNYYDNNDKRDSKRKESKNGDLNFKYIFFDNE